MYSLAVIGGDLRTVKLIDIFSQNTKFKIQHYGFDLLSFSEASKKLKFNISESNFNQLASDNLASVLNDCNIILLPLPTIKNGCINAPFSSHKIEFEKIVCEIEQKQLLLTGSLNSEFKTRENIIDYYHGNEQLIIKNAITTSEGAIMLAIQYTQKQIHGSKCLVLGYGRIGKVLSQTLKALSAHTTVSARNLDVLSCAEAFGLKTIELKDLSEHIHKYDIILNTIPHLILEKTKLNLVNKQSLILDLADGSGGVDFDYATKIGLSAIQEMGIPGKIAPITAAENIYKSVIRIIRDFYLK